VIATGQLGRILRLAAGLVFAGLLVFAPLNFGSTRAGGSEELTAGCIVATLLWIASIVCGGPRARVPLGAAGSVALLTLAAIPWIAGLASPTSVTSFTQIHFSHIVTRWPYSIVWRTPGNTLALTLALAASALPLIDLARTRGWALTFSIALCVTAGAIALLALLQNYTHASGIYWRNDGRMPGNFCGTFFHHTAAGAYFNTAWPLTLALTWLAWNRPRPAFVTRALALAGSLATILLLAAHGSHVSRFPQVAALVVAPFLLLGLKVRGQRLWLFGVGAAVAIVFLVAIAGRAGEIGARWRLMFAATPALSAPIRSPESAWPALMRDDLFVPNTSRGGLFGDRGESWRTALRCIAVRPLTGHGPGNWMGAASHHSNDPFVRTFFQFLQFTHQDLLQFAVEWGVPATLGWWGLLAGAIVVVLCARCWLSPLHHQLGIAAACALAAVLLQAQIDFPLEMPAIALNAIVLASLCWAGVGRHAEAPLAS
jgi:hypothetical protein